MIIKDITEYNKTLKNLKHLAYYDQLTKIPNRTLFLDRAETAIRQARRDKADLAIVYIDIDGFKSINDTMGHGAGDLLLVKISKRLHSCIRISDTLARIGGDEFSILMPKINHLDDASKLAKRINKSNRRPINISGKDIILNTSIGISIFPCDGDNISTLMNNADKAMYNAKNNKLNKYSFYNNKT